MLCCVYSSSLQQRLARRKEAVVSSGGPFLKSSLPSLDVVAVKSSCFNSPIKERSGGRVKGEVRRLGS